jgi:Ca-activated chloride channel family protein
MEQLPVRARETRRRERPGAPNLLFPLLLFCLALPGPSGGSAAAQAPPDLGAAVDPSAVGAGSLLWNSPRGSIPLPLLDLRVDLEVTGMMVRGTVRQSFHNPTTETLEAVYVFPLPGNAAVHQMEMHIGERRIVSVIREREEAKKTYEAAKAEGRKAALVEQDRPNLFTASAANINPEETVEVILEYLQELEYIDGEFRLVVPLTYTPRCFPASPGDASPAPQDETTAPERSGADGIREAPFVPSGSARAPRAQIVTRIRPGLPLEGEDVAFASHPVFTWWDGDALVVEPRDGTLPADRDYRLTWKPLLGLEPQTAAFVEERADGRYALILIVPPLDEHGAGWGLPTETLFILDVSGSMQGPSIRQAREALIAALERLRPEDTFDILTFNDRLETYAGRFLPGDPREVAAARDWVAKIDADGGTRIDLAVDHGLAMMGGGSTGRVPRIVFLTDGAVGNEEAVLASVREKIGAVRLHTLGIGSAPNRYLLRKMAGDGRGLCEFIDEGDDADNRIDRFFTRLDRPVLAAPRLEWDGGADLETFPERLPDLHAGEPLYVSARIPSGGSVEHLALTGRLLDGPARFGMEVADGASKGSGLATRWARAKVAALMDRLREGADAEEVRRAVVAVAIEHHLVTRYTSLVAVEEFPTAAGPARRARVPNGLPAGSEILGVLPRGGTRDPLWLGIGLLLAAGGAVVLVAARRS